MTNVSIVAWKRGMTQVMQNGKVFPVTLLEVKPHQVFRIKTKKVDGYNAVCFSVGDEVSLKNVSKPLLKQFEKRSLKPREELFEVRIDSDSDNLNIEGNDIDLNFLASLVGQKVDVRAKTVGKGFAGVMKRWNFRGLEASHGVSITHRSHGSTGQRQDPGKVFKGKKMAGHLGDVFRTTQNLDVVLFDKDLNLLGLKGSVPGGKNGVVCINTAVKLGSSLLPESLNGLKVIYS